MINKLLKYYRNIEDIQPIDDTEERFKMLDLKKKLEKRKQEEDELKEV